jgi:hypothetical protein
MITLACSRFFLAKNALKQEISKDSTTSAFTIPEIPEKYNLDIVNESDQKLNKVKWLKSDKEFGFIPLTGKEYILYRTVRSVDEEYNYPLYDDFTKDFTISNGWHRTFSSVDKKGGNTDLIFDEYRILGDLLSPTITNYTFAKVLDNEILIVNYNEYVDNKFLIKHATSVDYTYPHEREYRIFISNPVTIAELLDMRVSTAEWL